MLLQAVTMREPAIELPAAAYDEQRPTDGLVGTLTEVINAVNCNNHVVRMNLPEHFRYLD